VRVSLLVSLAVSLIGAGCGAASSSSEVSLADGTPTVSFAADFSVTQSGPLVAGARAVLHYDPARLPRCRMTYHGGDAWAILAWYRGDDGAVHNGPVTQLQGMRNVGVDLSFTVPFARDLAVWFENSDESGCLTWDSRFGENFHFAVEPPPAPVVHFRRDYQQDVDGTLAAGGALIVDYDLDRLTGCRALYNSYQSWDVTAHVRFDGGAVQSASVTQVAGLYGRVTAPATFAVPADAHGVEIWFENTDRTGCEAWDSNYGRNYSFTLD
jgi:hypothetical protein